MKAAFVNAGSSNQMIKMPKVRILLPALMLLLHVGLSGQSYDVAAGIRLGTDWGVTGKMRFAQKATAELIIQSGIKNKETMISALAMQHNPILTRRLNVFFGGGLHKGWLNNPDEAVVETPKDPFGLSLIGGIEFSIGRMNLTWDYKPAINLIGGRKTIYHQSGISLRYVFIKRAKLLNDRKKFNWKFWQKND